jgi:4-hydroxy-2,2'-bipyrrole-5-carbaldehyde O-methyltransferase
MRLDVLWKVARSGRVGTLRSLTGVMSEFTRACFLVSAARAGVLAGLAEGPLALEGLATKIEIGELEQLAAWLDVGVALGELGHAHGEYWLKGTLARALADARNDDMLAMLEELTSLHHRIVLDSPVLLGKHTRLSLADQPGDVVARSSRLVEPFIEAALEQVVLRQGPLHVLEVGCGSGTYMHKMTARNPELRVLGLELQPEVADQARQTLERWGVKERATVEAGDVRAREPDGSFDLVTLHNNIYYFPVAERVGVLRHLHGFLKPNGTLVVTTATRGGSPSSSVLNLWGVMTEGCGQLPTPAELCDDLAKAGFADVRSENLAAPVERFHAFYATRRASAPIQRRRK